LWAHEGISGLIHAGAAPRINFLLIYSLLV
jgi:hypothetical protein